MTTSSQPIKLPLSGALQPTHGSRKVNNKSNTSLSVSCLLLVYLCCIQCASSAFVSSQKRYNRGIIEAVAINTNTFSSRIPLLPQPISSSPTSTKKTARWALPTPEESAQALTDFMAKAHEEKLRAVKEVEQKYKARIEELETKLAACEAEKRSKQAAEPPTTLLAENVPSIEDRTRSYEFPATNKALSEKVGAYQRFLSEYIVQAQIDKIRAVADAEKKLKEHYEAIIEDLKRQQEKQQQQ